MKRALLFTLVLIFAAFSSYGQKSFSDDYESYSDGYDITAEGVYSINVNKTKSATVVVDPVNDQNQCVVMEGLDDGTTGLTFKIGSGSAFSGFTSDDNGDYVFKGKVKSELGGLIKLTIYGTTDLEDVVVGSSNETDWVDVTTTFTVNTTDTIYPTFVVYSYKNQKVYFDNILIEKAEATAIKDVSNIDVNVYPNPATNVVNIEGLYAVKKVDITDLSGKTVVSVNDFSGTQLDVSGLRRGVYLMKITTDKGIKVVKFVKK